MVVSNIFLFSPRKLGKIFNLTSIFFKWVPQPPTRNGLCRELDLLKVEVRICHVISVVIFLGKGKGHPTYKLYDLRDITVYQSIYHPICHSIYHPSCIYIYTCCSTFYLSGDQFMSSQLCFFSVGRIHVFFVDP